MINIKHCDPKNITQRSFISSDTHDAVSHHWCEQTFLDEASPQEATISLLKLLLSKDRSQYRPSLNYISTPPVGLRSDQLEGISETWRLKVCEWCYQVVDHYNFNREVVFIAINYLDRMVSLETTRFHCPVNKADFRLISVTSLYMAIKLHGTTMSNDGIRRKIRISCFYDLSERCFSIEQIEAMERRILSTLNWLVNPPTPCNYINALVSFCPRWESSWVFMTYDSITSSIRDLALYFTELAVSESRFTFTSSTLLVSYGSVLYAVASLKYRSRLPIDVNIAFSSKMTEAIDLSPDDEDVVRVISMLKEICPCPDIFLAEDNCEAQCDFKLANDRNGKVSPVSVMEAQINGIGFGLKRCSGGPNM